MNCGQLMTVPGIGPIIASATVAAIGNGAAFARGRKTNYLRAVYPTCNARPVHTDVP